MKWGKRLARGPGITVGLTKKRTIAMAKKDLDGLNKGEHLSIGLTKNRQEKYDARDKNKLEDLLKNPDKVNNGKLFVEKLIRRSTFK